MVVFGGLTAWFGYLQVMYGYCLLKGYDVRWRDLANPLNPYQWPPRGRRIPQIPSTQVLPSGPARQQQQATAATVAARAGGRAGVA